MTDPIALAHAARKRAYCPYSKYTVGACIEFEVDGKTHVEAGANVENASYGLSNCAERSAIFAAVSKHGTIKIRRVVVSTKDGGSPCGACRQVISEFGLPDCEVVCVDDKGKIKRVSFRDLLPDSFGPSNLE